MARLLARTLALSPPPAPQPFLRPVRGLSAKVELIEIDLAEDEDTASSSSSSSSGPAEEPRMRRLNDFLHGVMMRRARPEWLPFVPGGSYWVPPMRRQRGVSELVGIVTSGRRGGAVGRAENAVDWAALTMEEVMCFTTPRGWPSEAYFVEGKLWHQVKRSRKDATQTDDEDS